MSELTVFRAFSADRFSFDVPRARRLTLGYNLTSASRLEDEDDDENEDDLGRLDLG